MAGEGAQTDTSGDNHIEALKEKHASLETALFDENSRPMPNDSIIKNIKREKLSIKDELERLNPT